MRMRRNLAFFSLWLLAGISACGGGGGGGAASPYTGSTAPAVVTTANADNIARAAYQGGDLAAGAAILSPARSGGTLPGAGKPLALSLVRLLSEAANSVLPSSPPVRTPAPRAMVTVDNTVSDGMGGTIHFVLSVNDVTGAFTGTFAFTNFHGDGGGVINGTVGVSGTYVQGQGITGILFNFGSVGIVDGAVDVTAFGTVDLVFVAGGGTATLDMVFVDNRTRKTVWLSNFTVVVTDLGVSVDVAMSGRIYLHDYGYVDVRTEAGFIYPAGGTLPTSGAMTVTGKDSKGLRMTVNSQTQYTLDVDSDGDGAYDDLTVTLSW